MLTNTSKNNQKERIYVLGSTGHVGSFVVDELIKMGAHITVYTRSPKKLYTAVPNAKGYQDLDIIQGGYEDLTPFNASIGGHKRLFLLVPDIENMAEIKINMGKKAYASGVQQIVDLSVQFLDWRIYQLTLNHQETEKALFDLPERRQQGGRLVSLRPGNFMTNMYYSAETIKSQNKFMEELDHDELQEWVSPFDIGQVAARILMDHIDKHGDVAYELIGDVIAPKTRAQLFSELLGRSIRYEQVDSQVIYDLFIQMGFDHCFAFSVSTYSARNPVVSRGLKILLGRQPETVQAWLAKNKHVFDGSSKKQLL